MPATLPQAIVNSAKSGGQNPWPPTAPALGSAVVANSYVLAFYSNYKTGLVGGTVTPSDPLGGDTYTAAYDPGYDASGGGFVIATGAYIMTAPAISAHSATWAYPSNTRTGIASILEVNPGGVIINPVDQMQTGNTQLATSPLTGATITLGQLDSFVYVMAQLVATVGLANAGLSVTAAEGALTRNVNYQTSNSGTALWSGYSLNWAAATVTPSVSWSADASIVNVNYTIVTFKNFAGAVMPPFMGQILL